MHGHERSLRNFHGDTMTKYNSPRGTGDLLPEDVLIWRKLESSFVDILALCGYGEIRTPLIEQRELFIRSIGSTTDIVTKEMYDFQDKKGRWLALRPEGTAGVVRAAIEHGMLGTGKVVKLFYYGPMYRYERPQKGRQREFWQLGIEILGTPHPSADVEIIEVSVALLSASGLSDFTIELNSLGCEKCRPLYRDALLYYLRKNKNALCDDCRERMEKNPLRVLDCKKEQCRAVVRAAPHTTDYLCDECKNHFDEVQKGLDKLQIHYVLNPEIVRGLDYYSRTTFEIKSCSLGAQDAVLAGGRYDYLVGELGGPMTPAVGMALGMERLVLAANPANTITDAAKRRVSKKVFVARAPGVPWQEAAQINSYLRSLGFRSEYDLMDRTLKSQLRQADSAGTRHVVILGEDEIEQKQLRIRDMKEGSEILVSKLELESVLNKE